MTAIHTDVPDTPSSTASRDARAHHETKAAEGPKTPYLLLWSTGIAAAVIGIAAFVLWGVNGVSTLFDMIVALCT
jgi:hypothetical protein